MQQYSEIRGVRNGHPLLFLTSCNGPGLAPTMCQRVRGRAPSGLPFPKTEARAGKAELATGPTRPLSTPHLHSSTHMPSSCRHWICCGIGGIALCSRGTASCSLSIVPLVYTINSAALHHVSGDEMMERCTAYSTVASGASAEALIETSRYFWLRAALERGPLEQQGAGSATLSPETGTSTRW